MENKLDNKLDKLEYKNYMNSLFDLYGELLTEKQSAYFTAYYFEDLSLREIASSFEVSSNAVYDQIKNIEKTLEKYEASLHLLSKMQKSEEIFEKLDSLYLDENTKKLIDELKNI